MSTLAVLEATAAISAGPLDYLDFRAKVEAIDPCPGGVCDFDPSAVLELAVTVNSVSEGVRPRASREQIVLPFKITADGVEIPTWKRLPGMTVTESLEGRSASFELAQRAKYPSAYTEALGSASTYYGPPPGKALINIDARFATSDGLQTVRLMTDGLVENSSVSAGSKGDTRRFNVLGMRSRYDQKEATFTLSPGHGLTRHRVARDILLDAGIPSAKIAFGSGGRHCYKGVQIVDENAQGFVEGYLRPGLVQLYEDRDGKFVTVPLAPTDEPAAWTFTEQDVLDASVGEESNSEGPTCIRITGSQQVLRDDEGLRTEIQYVETYGTTPPARCAFSQDGDGDLTALSGGSPPGGHLYLRSRVCVEREYRGDTLVSERTSTEGWYNPRAWRYEVAAAPDFTIDTYNPNCFILSSDAVKDDSNQAYLYRREYFTLTSQAHTRYIYDDETGFLNAVVTETSGYVVRYNRLKERSADSDSWETTNYDDAAKILGDGNAIVSGSEQFIGPYARVPLPPPNGGDPSATTTDPLNWYGNSAIAAAETTSYTITEDGYIQKETTELEEWALRDGSRYLFGGGYESANSSSTFQTTAITETAYMPSGESSHLEVTTTVPMNGQMSLVREGQRGYAPAAERSLDMIDPTWASTFSDEDLQYVAAASRFETQPLKYQVCSAALSANREAWTKRISDEWAEDLTELINLANVELRSSAIVEVQFALPFNPLVRPATRVHLSLPSLGWERDLWVTEVSHTEGDKGTTTRVTGEEWTL